MRTPLSPVHRGGEARNRWAAPLSLVLHGALIVMILLLPAPRHAEPPVADGIEVEIVGTPPSVAEPDRMAPPPLPPDTAAPLSPPPPPAAAMPATPPPSAADRLPQADPDRLPQEPPRQRGMVTATRMMAGKILDDPENRETRAMLASLLEDEQMIQLCSLEAMEQVAAWKSAYEPKQLVPYAREDTELTATTVRAPGGAFFSKGKWFEIEFECEVTPDRRNVVAFAFRVGEPIPPRDWEAFDLPEGDGEDMHDH